MQQLEIERQQESRDEEAKGREEGDGHPAQEDIVDEQPGRQQGIDHAAFLQRQGDEETETEQAQDEHRG